MYAMDLQVGQRFRWRPMKESPWQYFICVAEADENGDIRAKCKHGIEDRFNGYAHVELDPAIGGQPND